MLIRVGAIRVHGAQLGRTRATSAQQRLLMVASVRVVVVVTSSTMDMVTIGAIMKFKARQRFRVCTTQRVSAGHRHRHWIEPRVIRQTRVIRKLAVVYALPLKSLMLRRNSALQLDIVGDMIMGILAKTAIMIRQLRQHFVSLFELILDVLALLLRIRRTQSFAIVAIQGLQRIHRSLQPLRRVVAGESGIATHHLVAKIVANVAIAFSGHTRVLVAQCAQV
mmetsp:Transcript_27768/g.45806  ORF Transcript_27768/g.45806 Transcript_27768/m.45806 type:complete len:222 (-) Transcript_27768:650-1315(-)